MQKINKMFWTHTTDLGAKIKVVTDGNTGKYYVTITSDEVTGLKLAKHFQNFLAEHKAVFHAIHKMSENKFNVITSLDVSRLEQCEY